MTVMQNNHLLQEKQPTKLYLLSLISMWERFGFYTMRGILVLYMTKLFVLSNHHAYSIFAIFSAFLYLAPIAGGHIADRFLGAKASVIIGGLILSSGYMLLAIPNLEYLYIGLATIIIGSGFFAPNIATLVSHLYQGNDIRREGGFSLFYTAINVGSFIPPLFEAYLIYQFGWWATFIMAGISVLFSVVICALFLKNDSTRKHNFNLLNILALIMMLAAVIFSVTYLIHYTFLANTIIFTFSAFFIMYAIYKSRTCEKVQRDKLCACFILIILSIIFSILYEQAGMSLTIYAEFNVSRAFMHWTIPTVTFQSLSPFFIIVLGPCLAKLWTKLGKRSLNPSIPIKFGLGTCFMGFGFIILLYAIASHSHAGQINSIWIVLSYFFQTVGEMLISPIGLSMVSELSPAKMLGFMMGTWYFATAVADALAGFVSGLTTTASGTNDPLITSPTYAHIFGLIGFFAILVGIFILAVSSLISKMIGKKPFDQ